MGNTNGKEPVLNVNTEETKKKFPGFFIIRKNNIILIKNKH